MLNNVNDPATNYTGNEITALEWTTIMEANGAVFLPTTGQRNVTTLTSLGSDGRYWSVTYADKYSAYALSFDRFQIMPNGTGYRSRGYSVRLVQDY